MPASKRESSYGPASETGVAEELVPAFSQLLNAPFVPPPSLNDLAVSSGSSFNEPLHLIIGEENEASAEGYAMPRLGDDFLTQQPQPVHTNAFAEEELRKLKQPSVVPRRPKQPQPLFKRLSAEFPAAFTPPPPAQPFLHRGTSCAVTAGPVPQASAATGLGHRRSASHGNPTQVWTSTGITQHQQSMPCIANLVSEPIFPSFHQSFGKYYSGSSSSLQP